MTKKVVKRSSSKSKDIANKVNDSTDVIKSEIPILTTKTYTFHGYNVKLRKATCISASKSGLFAVSYDDGSIDIHQTSTLALIGRLHPNILGCVEKICWVKERLFAVGITGSIHEICLSTVLVKGYVRSIDSNERNIIVGNDDGFVSIFAAAENDIDLLGTPAKVNGKILSVAIDDKSKLAAAGTDEGVLYIVDVILSRVKSSFSLKTAETDKQLFSGDSRGTVSVWNTSVGSIIKSFNCHEASVLTIEPSIDGTMILAAGVDGIISKYKTITNEKGDRSWIANGMVQGCRRDVHGLLLLPNTAKYDATMEDSSSDRVVAVGQSGSLEILAVSMSETGTVSRSKPYATNPHRIGQTEHDTTTYLPMCIMPLYTWGQVSSVCSFAYKSDTCMFLVKYDTVVHLMRIIRKEDHPQEVVKLAEIYPVKNKFIASSCISPDGKLVAYSDADKTRVLSIQVNNIEETAEKIEVSISRLEWQKSLSFTPKKRKRTSSTESNRTNNDTQSDSCGSDIEENGKLYSSYFEQNKDWPSFNRHLKPKKLSSSYGLIESASRIMEFSPDGRYLITVPQTQNDELLCWSTETGDLVYQVTVKKGSRIDKICIWPLERSCFLMGVCCADGRVGVLSGTSGTILVKCPRQPYIDYPSCPDLPLDLAFLKRDADDTVLMTILYCTGKMEEWVMHISQDEEELSLNGKAEKSPWLTELWAKAGGQLKASFWSYRSLQYINEDKWGVQLNDAYIKLHRDRPIDPALVNKKIKYNEDNSSKEPFIKTKFDRKLNTVENQRLPYFQGMVKIDPRALSIQLPAAMYRKKFGL